MIKISALLGLGASVLMLGVAPVPALAQAGRTFVSGHGSDSGTCTNTAPCRSFAFAIGQTAASGEIAVLDTAGYGSLTITKSISIVNPGGVEAGVAVAPGGNAITINALATDKVALRGLTIEGGGIGLNGIVFNSGAALDIVDCVVRDFTGDGVTIAPTGTMTFFMLNTIASNNGANGINIAPVGTGTAAGTIDHASAIHNANGIMVNGGSTSGPTINATITNSVASGNSSPGILSIGGTAATAVTVTNSKSSNNGYGYYTGNSGTMRIGQSVATANTNYGVYRSGGSMISYGDNYFSGNGNSDTIFGGLTGLQSKQ